MSEEDKKPFLIGFDYMKAGYWGMMLACSKSEIQSKWPEVVIVEDRPGWMTQDDYDKYLADPYDVDAAPHGILNIVIDSRRGM